MVPTGTNTMNFPVVPIDVDALFGLARPTVQSLAANSVQSDLKVLNLQWTGNAASPFTAEDMQHARDITDRYTQDHPFGFLAKTSPIIAQGMMTDALRRDVAKNLDAYNTASGNFQDADSLIANLHHQGSSEFGAATQSAFNAVHRGVLVKTAKDLHTMAKLAGDGLWGTTTYDERAMHDQLQQSAKTLDKAVARFDQGNTEEAMAQFNSAMDVTSGYASWFGRSLRQSEQQKFAAHIGVTLAASIVSAGMGSLVAGALAGGARAASLGWKIFTFSTSSLVSGTTFVMANRALDKAVFKTPFLHKETVYDNVMDLSAESLHMTLLMGWMHGVGKVAARLPKLTGDMAATIGWTRAFAVEFSGLTTFNVASAYTTHLVDPSQPGVRQVISPEALIESAVFLLGLKAGNAMVRGVPTALQWSANQLSQLGPVRAFAAMGPKLRLSGRAVLLSPLTLIMGVSADIGPSRRVSGDAQTLPVGDGFKALAQSFSSFEGDPTMTDVHNMFQGENWLVLTALASTHLGIPKTTTAMKVSGGKFDGSHPLFTSIDLLLKNPSVQYDADFILREGLNTYYGNSNVRAQMPNAVRMAVDSLAGTTDMPSPIEALQKFLTAAAKVHGLIAQTSAAIASGTVIIGTQKMRLTHGSEIEVAAPNYDPDPLANRLFLDPMMESLAAALEGKGYRVETERSDQAAFTAKVMIPDNPGTMPYPFVYDYFSTTDGRYFLAETYRGTGAYLITLKEINPTTREVLSSDTKHLKFIRDEDGQFRRDADGKKVPIGSVADCRVPILQLLGSKLGFEDPIADVNAAIASDDVTTRTGFLLLIKGADGDILKVIADVDYTTKMAKLTPLNGKFIIPGLDHVYLPDLERTDENPVGQIMRLVTDELRTRISGKRFAMKDDRIQHITVTRPGGAAGSITIQAVNEAHPFAEFISGIMTPDVIDIWQSAVEAMTDLGWLGTANDRLIGRHVHVGVSGKTPEGRWTIRPLAMMSKAVKEWAPHFRELFPSNERRGGFNQTQANEVDELFNSPHFDPENPDHILLTGLFIAGYNPQKYTAFNPDNTVAKVIRNMVGDGTFEKGSTREVTWNGQTYKFSITGMTREETIQHLVSEGHAEETLKPKQIDDAQYHSYEIEGTLPDGRTMSVLRVPAVADKWTWEVRFPDTVMDGAHDTFLIRSFLAFAYQFGHAPLWNATPNAPKAP